MVHDMSTLSSRHYKSRRNLSATEARSLSRLLLLQAIDPGMVGNRIRQARLEAGLTQDEFARLVNVTLRTVQHWEAGDSVPYRTMDAIGKALNREVTWFLHGDEDDRDIASELRGMFSDLSERLDAIESVLREPPPTAKPGARGRKRDR